MLDNCNNVISDQELAIANERCGDIATGDKVVTKHTAQSTNAYVDYRTVDIHLFLQECFDGDGGFLGVADGVDKYGEAHRSYIHEKPTENFYINRVAFAQYFNEFRIFVKNLIKPIFSAGVEYTTTNKGFLDFVTTANGTGSSYNEIKERAGMSAVVHQSSFLIIDRRLDTGKVYVAWKSVNSVFGGGADKGYETSEYGDLSWIAFFASYDSSRSIYIRHKYMAGGVLVQEKGLSDKTWVDVEFRPSGIDEINVYPMFYEPSPNGEYVVEKPAMKDVAYMCANVYNHDCRIEYVEVQQGHGTLAIITDAEIKGIPDSMSNALIIPSNADGSSGDAKYITIDAEILKTILASSDKKRALLHWMMGDKGVDVKQVTTAESGVAKAFEFMGRNAELLAGVNMFERLDEWVVNMYKLLTSDTTDFDVEITYASDFYPDSDVTIDELQVLDTMFAQTDAVDARKEIYKKALIKILKGASHEVLQARLAEVDAMNFNDPVDNIPVLD